MGTRRADKRVRWAWLKSVGIILMALTIAACEAPDVSDAEDEAEESEVVDTGDIPPSDSDTTDLGDILDEVDDATEEPIAEEPVAEEPVVEDPVSEIPAPRLEVCHEDNYKQNDAEFLLQAVDIVFVMDTSGSMSDEWEKVANNLDKLFAELPAGIDANYAVIVGHDDEYEGVLFGDPNYPKVMKSTELTNAQIVTAMKSHFDYAESHGDAGNGGEATFKSLHTAVTKNLARNQSQGIFRADAALSVIFVSDEHEIGSPFPKPQAPGLPDRCDAFFEDKYKEREYDDKGINLKVVHNALVKANGDQPLAAHAFVNITKKDLFTNNSESERCLYDSLGYGYFDLVELTGGVLFSLQEARSEAMKKVGEYIKRNLTLSYDFPISKPSKRLDVSTIVARVDNEIVNHTYNPETYIVHLEEAGDALSDIKISYCEFDHWSINELAGTSTVDSISVSWNTDDVNTTAVLSYGTSITNLDKSINFDTASNQFEATLNGLPENTIHYFRVSAVDQHGFTGQSDILEVRTKKKKVREWEISDVKSEADIRSINLSWNTEGTPTSASVVYVANGEEQSIEVNDLKAEHSIVLDDLEPNTEYAIEISGEDVEGFQHSETLTVKTNEDIPPVLVWEIKGLDGTTKEDYATIIWQTGDVPTSAVLRVGLSPDNLTLQVINVDSPATMQIVKVKGLASSTRHYFQVTATDANGDSKVSNTISKKTKAAVLNLSSK